jgi:hypothetical protein
LYKIKGMIGRGGGNMTHNRRQFTRWKMNHPAQLRPEGEINGSECHIFDLSLKGGIPGTQYSIRPLAVRRDEDREGTE